MADPVLCLTSPAHVAGVALKERIPSVSPRHTELRGPALQILRDAGLTVGAFALQKDAAIAWALDADLDVFTTDRPDAALLLPGARG